MVKGDSELVIKFGTRENTPRSTALYTNMDAIMGMIKEAKVKIFFGHVPREANALADGLGRLAVSRGGDVTLSDMMDITNPP